MRAELGFRPPRNSSTGSHRNETPGNPSYITDRTDPLRGGLWITSNSEARTSEEQEAWQRSAKAAARLVGESHMHAATKQSGANDRQHKSCAFRGRGSNPYSFSSMDRVGAQARVAAKSGNFFASRPEARAVPAHERTESESFQALTRHGSRPGICREIREGGGGRLIPTSTRKGVNDWIC